MPKSVIRQNLFEQIRRNSGINNLKIRRICIAFSGGPDSVFLTLFFLELRKSFSEPEIVLAYFNHQLRSDSHAEDQFVREFSVKHGLKLYTGKGDIRNLSEKSGISTEMAARKLRHEFLENTRITSESDYTVLGHHLNDQAETVLIRMIRGCGLSGIRGMKTVSDKLLRPLLKTSREEIMSYLNKSGIKYYSDPTNEKTDFQRNYVRHKIIPLILKINPAFPETVSRSTENFREAEEYIQNESRTELEKVLILNKNHFLLLDSEKLRKLHPVIFSEIMKILLQDTIVLDRAAVARIRETIFSAQGTRFDLSRRVYLEHHKQGFLILFKDRLANWKDVYIEFNSCTGMIPCWEICYSAEKTGKSVTGDRYSICLPQHLFPLKMRFWLPGDRVLQNHCDRLLKRFFQENGIPVLLRKYWPVIIDCHGTIVWVPGLYCRQYSAEDSEILLHIRLEEALFEPE